MKNIILASNSPARFKLLTDNGYNVIKKPTNIIENSNKTKPFEIVEDLALQKLEACIKSLKTPINQIIIASDTMIYYKNELIGKAENQEEAYLTLRKLSNNTHKIYSSYALYFPNGKIKSGYGEVDITFKNLSDLTIMNYLSKKEWIGAAGSYRIQGEGIALIKEINGEFNVAVGLPLNAISALIETT
jgi:septum formation protein